VITAGWAFAVMAGVFTAVACGSSDAHLNPAVTLGFAVRAGSFAKCLPYITAQLLGAMAGAALVWLHYLPHWRETPDAGTKLACFCTAPAIRNVVANLISEIIGTAVLVFVVGAIFSKAIAATGTSHADQLDNPLLRTAAFFASRFSSLRSKPAGTSNMRSSP